MVMPPALCNSLLPGYLRLPRMPQLSTSMLLSLLFALAMLAVIVTWVMMRPQRRQERALRRTIRHISLDILHDIVVPDGVDGEVQIDTLLLTQRGWLILEIKHADGKLFGGERMDNWTALSTRRRITFANPLPVLRRREVALMTLFKDVPVHGRVVFAGDVELGADLPASVTTVPQLYEEFPRVRGRSDQAPAGVMTERWDELRRMATA